LYMEIGRLEEALKVCGIVLESDPLIEEVYRLKMRVYAAQGDRVAVLRQYQTCSDIFRDELGIKPSKETEELYRRLI
jgi:two-component SAPR family response regulator